MSAKTGIGIIIAVLALVLIAGVVYVHAFTKIELRDVKVTNVHNVSLGGFFFDGEIDVYNGAIITTSIDHIEYDVILEPAGKKIAEGIILGGKIPSKQITTFPFSNEVKWGPTAEAAIAFIMSGNLTLKISGTVYVADLNFIQITVPFEQRINVADYLRYHLAELLTQKPTVAGIATAIKKIGEFLG